MILHFEGGSDDFECEGVAGVDSDESRDGFYGEHDEWRVSVCAAGNACSGGRYTVGKCAFSQSRVDGNRGGSKTHGWESLFGGTLCDVEDWADGGKGGGGGGVGFGDVGTGVVDGRVLSFDADAGL